MRGITNFDTRHIRVILLVRVAVGGIDNTASRSRLLETEPKLFVFETLYYAFCGRYCFESVASKIE